MPISDRRRAREQKTVLGPCASEKINYPFWAMTPTSLWGT